VDVKQLKLYKRSNEETNALELYKKSNQSAHYGQRYGKKKKLQRRSKNLKINPGGSAETKGEPGRHLAILTTG